MKTVVYKVAPQLAVLDLELFEVLDRDGVQRVLKCEMDAPSIVETWTRAATGLRVIRVCDEADRILYRSEGSDFDQMGIIGTMHNTRIICEYDEECGEE